MKKNTMILGISLIGLSIALHVAHFAIFRDAHHIMIFLLADIAFIPLEVFFVSLVLDKLIEKREKSQTIKKINMLVGLFYQEIGNGLLSILIDSDRNIGFGNTNVNFRWDKEDYDELAQSIKNHNHQIDITGINLPELNDLISKQQQLITSLITNPSISEHEQFSEVLLSLFHLAEELKQRPLEQLSTHDFEHLTADIERVYRNLSIEWVGYLKHLQKEYPYLFLSAISNNPFDIRDRADIELEVLESR